VSGRGRADPNRAKGLAFSDYDGTMLAAVAEISLERTSGAIRVHHIWAAADPGLVLQPDNSLSLIEGGLIFGVGMAPLRMNEAPELYVELMPSDTPPTGLGEISPIIAPAAIGNAFAALTGRRLRHLPMIPERVLAAMT